MPEPGVFRAPIDTTFALYRKGTTEFSYDALRTGYPYVARHLGWYVNSSNPPADEHFYHQRVAQNTADSPATSYWSGDNLHPLLLATSSWHADIRKRVALRTRLRRLL